MMSYLLEGQSTERLLFRKVVQADFDSWLPFHEEPLSSQYWEGLPTDPKKACKQQFDRIFARYQENLGGMNALISLEGSKFIGLCGLMVQLVDAKKELEIGYSILPQYWRNGFAFEAAEKCKTYAFQNDFAKSLISIIHINNVPSQKVALKNGMQLDKTTSYHNNPVHIFRVNQP